jgi:hypothetical protein
MLEPVRRLEVFTGAGRRRTWTAEQKAQSKLPTKFEFSKNAPTRPTWGAQKVRLITARDAAFVILDQLLPVSAVAGEPRDLAR